MQLPGGENGIGLDDLRFSTALGKLVVAGGCTGRVDLVDPATGAVDSIEGFSTFSSFNGGDQQGVESADEAGGLVYAVDRAAFTLSVIDPDALAVVATTHLDLTEPDYVRVSAQRGEVWISNPGADRVEVLTIDPAGGAPSHAAYITLDALPEGIALDETRGRAYVHGRGGNIVVIDMDARAAVDTWSTSCSGSHGIPVIDVEHSFLYAGCGDASVVVLDLDDDGAELGSFSLGSGSSIIAYAPENRHLYLRGDGKAVVVALAVSDAGELTELKRYTIPAHGHCLAADNAGSFWACDRDAGSLVRVDDLDDAAE